MSLDMYRFYEKCLLPLTPHPSVAKILELTMIGGETTEDFSKVIALDGELQHWIRLTVTRLGFDKRVRGITQMITLLGQNRVRDMIIGRHIERSFIPESETLLAKAIALRAAEKEKKEDASKKNPPKKKEESKSEEGKEAAGKESSNVVEPAATSEEEESIPPIAEFQNYLVYANKSEEIAMSIRNSYPGQAFAGGVIFDYCRYFLKKAVNPDEVEDIRLKRVDNYIEEVFKDGIRCGIAANEIMQKISIPHQKTVFVTALVHNLGKIVLFAYDPKKFEKAFMASTGSKDAKTKTESTEAESRLFDLDHAQAGALYVGRLTFLSEIERSIDYHHNPHLLRFSNPGLYALAAVLRVSGALVKLYQRLRQDDPDIQHLRDMRLLASEDFKFLKLSEDDWSDIKSNYALKLLKVGM